MNWTHKLPLWDHHCHALVNPSRRGDMEIFSRALTEAPADYPLADIHETVTFWHSLNIAASHLRVPAEESAVAAALAKTDYAGYCRTLFQEQGYQHLLIDTGYQPQDAWALHPLAEALDLQIHPIVRLETLAEQLMAECSTVDDWVGAIKIQLKNARNLGYIGVKSIVAYRSGLHVHPVARDIAQEAFHTMQQTGQTRLADPDLLNYVLWNTTPVLIDQALPLQFHTGYGDPDTDLLKGNPLLLRDYLRTFLPQGLRVALLHTYPYHREAGYLASVYPNVYFDVSLALPLAASGGVRIMQEALELAPVSRFLFASDAHSRPESYFLAAALWREGINTFLDGAVQAHHLPPSTAHRWAAMICWENCQSLYDL